MFHSSWTTLFPSNASGSTLANEPTSQSAQQLPPHRRTFATISQSQSRPLNNQQPRPVCTWSAHVPQSGPSPPPFPRYCHALTATPTASSELILFGGYVHGSASNDLYVFSTRDFSTTLLQTSGKVPSPRVAHGAALTSTNFLIWGGTTNFSDQNVLNQRQDDSLYSLNLVSHEWTRVVVNGPGPSGRYYHTMTLVDSKLFIFGGKIGRTTLNDMWAFDLNTLQSQPFWESYESTPGNEKPLPRASHVSVTTEDRIIIFGGSDSRHDYNDTWSFNISTRKWTELQCTGSIPSPRSGHAAVLIDDVMYVFGGFTMDKTYLDDLIALQLSTQRWFKFHNVGPNPHRRSCHTMASDGSRVFLLGGWPKGAQADEISLIHVLDTKHIKYPETDPNAVSPKEKTTQLAWKSSAGSLTQEKPQHSTPSSSEAHRASLPRKATPFVLGHSASPQITHEGDISSIGYRAAPHSFSDGDVARLELERQLLVSLAAQTERDQRIVQLTNELALKSALLEQAEANATEAAKRAGLELREHADPLLMESSRVKQRDVELRDMQAKPLSRDQQIEQYEKELANMRVKLEARESELEAVRLRLADAENGWIKSKAEADVLRAQSAAGFVNRDGDQVIHRLIERVRAIEAQMASMRWNEKGIEEMECRNEG